MIIYRTKCYDEISIITGGPQIKKYGADARAKKSVEVAKGQTNSNFELEFKKKQFCCNLKLKFKKKKMLMEDTL